MNIKLLKFIIRLENVLCVYRNYCMFSKIGRISIWLRIFVEIALAVFCVIYYTYTADEIYKVEVIYISLTTGTSAVISLLSLFKFREFRNFKFLIERNHDYFSRDSVYLEKLDKTFKFIPFLTVTYIILSGCSTLLFDVFKRSNKQVNVVVFRLYNFYFALCSLRYSVEYIVLYCLLFLLSEHVKCITRKISHDRNLDSFTSEEHSTTSNEVEVIQEITSFEEWTVAYTNIKECSKLINSIFGVQITAMLLTLTYYFIMFLYMLAYMSVYGYFVTSDVLLYSFKIISFLIALYALSRSAQTAQNSVNNLRRRLGKLLIYSSSDQDTYKGAKDFLHLVTSRPIITQAFGSINVDMTLVPKFVMFFTSYTIIALQFNNVV